METSPGHPSRRALSRDPVGAAPRRTGGDPRTPPPPRDPPVGRRRVALAALGMTAAASASALVAVLLGWSPEPAEPARPLTAAESERLAAMRVTNVRDVRAGVRVSVGAGDTRIELVGWVDWARPLVYLDVGGPGAGAEHGLVQATPSTVVLRPSPATAPTPAPPPLVPPTDRWRLREPRPQAVVGGVRDLLLGLGADRIDLVPLQARWTGRETAHGALVDILRSPLPGQPADPAHELRLWLDRDARVHRVRGRLPDGRPVVVELERSDRPTLRPVDALGGRPGLPRALTDGETGRLARIPARLRAAGGARLTLTAPLGPTANLAATGWLSWAPPSAYLSVGEADTPERRTLLRWQAGRVARAEIPTGSPATRPAAPPLPPPAGTIWTTARPPADDLERLMDAAVRAGSQPAPSRAAVRLRDDRAAERTVDVIEVSTRRTRLRYWVDRGGLLRRLELRTGRDVWAQLDLTFGRVPAPPAVPAPPGRR